MPIIYLVRKDSIPVYVGFTRGSLKSRWRKHQYDCNRKDGCPLLCNAIKKYGVDAFTIEEIYSSDDVDHTLNVMEPHFIREHHTHKDEGGYNISHGGDATVLGMKHTEETKEKIRMIHSGRKFTDEHRKKISLANKKRFSNPEERLKVSLSIKGQKKTEETKEKISLAAKKRWKARKERQLSTPPPSA